MRENIQWVLFSFIIILYTVSYGTESKNWLLQVKISEKLVGILCIAKLLQNLKTLMLDWILKEKWHTFMHHNDGNKGTVTGLFSQWTTLHILDIAV